MARMDEQARKSMMTRALRLARRGAGYVAPNPMVGAVVVKAERVIGSGYHERFGGPHAEVNALSDCRRAGHDPSDATMFVTLEPCCHHGKTGPCTEAIAAAGVKAVEIATLDECPLVAGKGIQWLREHGIDVRVGCCERDARRLNTGFFRLQRAGEPQVILKWAQSFDGKITYLPASAPASTATTTGNATANRATVEDGANELGGDPNDCAPADGCSVSASSNIPAGTNAPEGSCQPGPTRWITSERSRRHVHQVRSRCGAILVGIGTAMADDPLLNARLSRRCPQPLRVVLDSNLSLPADYQLVRTAADYPTTIYTLEDTLATKKQQARTLADSHCEIIPLPQDSGHIALRPLLRELGSRGITDLLVEGGPTIQASFLRQGLADKLLVYIAPFIMGPGQQSPAGMLGNVGNLPLPMPLFDVVTRRLGHDMLVEGYLHDLSC